MARKHFSYSLTQLAPLEKLLKQLAYNIILTAPRRCGAQARPGAMVIFDNNTTWNRAVWSLDFVYMCAGHP